jgi:hypothetical protein
MTYCTHGDISAFLQVDAFADGGSATTPTQAQVETFIGFTNERIDQITGHAWATARAKTVTEEKHHIQPVRNTTVGYRGKIRLNKYPIVAMASTSSPSVANLYIWDGSTFVDYCDSDLKTKGTTTNPLGGDWWEDIQRGFIYLKSWALTGSKSSPIGYDAMVTYKYATATVPDDIKQAAIYMTSAFILSNEEYGLRIGEGSDSLSNSEKIANYEEMANKILDERTRRGRDIVLATNQTAGNPYAF